jgi:hypothetical protein
LEKGKQMKRTTLAFLVMAAFAAYAPSAPVPSITLLPSSSTGGPGSVVGWGFVLTYSAPSDWVVLTGSEFTGSQLYGTYRDYLSLPNTPLYVAGPAPENSTVQQQWNPSSNPPLGVGEFDFNSTAIAPANITGNILVHYSVFSQDPNAPDFNPDTSTVVADATLSAPVQVNVAPEPASLLMMSPALLLLLLANWRRVNQRR